MIRNLQPCACSGSATRRLGDAAGDLASYQPGGSNYTPGTAEDSYSPGTPINYGLTFTPDELASLFQTSPATTSTTKTNWPLVGAAALGTILLLATLLPQPTGRGRR
jgi:hypothetical protein